MTTPHPPLSPRRVRCTLNPSCCMLVTDACRQVHALRNETVICIGWNGPLPWVSPAIHASAAYCHLEYLLNTFCSRGHSNACSLVCECRLRSILNAHRLCSTMRFGSTARVLLKCKLKYYRFSECVLISGSKGGPYPLADRYQTACACKAGGRAAVLRGPAAFGRGL